MRKIAAGKEDTTKQVEKGVVWEIRKMAAVYGKCTTAKQAHVVMERWSEGRDNLVIPLMPIVIAMGLSITAVTIPKPTYAVQEMF